VDRCSAQLGLHLIHSRVECNQHCQWVRKLLATPLAQTGSVCTQRLAPWLCGCRQYVTALAQAFYWARDMINTPAEDMGPQHLVAEATAMAAAHPGAQVKVIQVCIASCNQDLAIPPALQHSLPQPTIKVPVSEVDRVCGCADPCSFTG
jgi:hypothetical protein